MRFVILSVVCSTHQRRASLRLKESRELNGGGRSPPELILAPACAGINSGGGGNDRKRVFCLNVIPHLMRNPVISSASGSRIKSGMTLCSFSATPVMHPQLSNYSAIKQ